MKYKMAQNKKNTLTTFGLEHRFQLERYKGMSSKHICPSCKQRSFTRYIDLCNGEAYVGDDLGRCDKIEKCGYHAPPTKDNMNGVELFVPKHQIPVQYQKDDSVSTIDSRFVTQTHFSKLDNNLSKFLLAHFEEKNVLEILNRYFIGTHTHWDKSTIFWQIDKDWDVRTGKIMLYDPTNGKRIKQPYNHINWAHTQMKKKHFGNNVDFNLKQCFFGEHLLTLGVDKFNVVESEKTALICSIKNPSTYWIATGGIENIGLDRLTPFKDCELTFFPDKGAVAVQKWQAKIDKFKKEFNLKLNTFLETEDSVEDGDDLADYIIKKI